MSEAEKAASNQVEVLLSAVCQNAQAIRERLSSRPNGPELVETVLNKARAGQDTTDSLEVLDTALAALGERKGLHGYLGFAWATGDRGLNAVGIDRSRPSWAKYHCPRNRCARVWEPSPAEEVPSCYVDGVRLKRTPAA
ncbi:hypothetical protein GCM10009551_015260 [Nocardiopsis tropica]